MVPANLLTVTHFLRWFSACNVSIPSETKMRKRAAEIIGDNIMVEKVPLTFSLKEGGEEVKLRPYGYIPDLWTQIAQPIIHASSAFLKHLIASPISV